ncbi:MAG: hypothetical protein ACJAT5_000300 [Lentimonas sp.]|jgi:hypothetical protein
MGKKTIAFIATLTKQTAALAKAAAALLAAETATAKVSAQFLQLADAETQRVAVINPGGGDMIDGQSSSVIINADPIIVKIGNALDKLGTILMDRRATVAKARAAVAAAKQPTLKNLAEFKKYVATKKAAWTLKGKKTVLAAEAFIQSTETALALI